MTPPAAPVSAAPATPSTTPAATPAEPALPDDGIIRPLVEGLIVFLETCEPPDGLFRPDVFCDLSLPYWRVQAQGPQGLVRLRQAGGHAGPGRVVRWHADPIPDGFVFEFEERWDADGERWYCREFLRAGVRDRSIAELSVYCTGDWDGARQGEHARSVALLRP